MSEERDLIETLTTRAESYRLGGPSSEHTAALLDEAASEIQRLRGEVERLRSGLQKIASMTRTAATEEVDAWELRQIARDALNLQGE